MKKAMVVGAGQMGGGIAQVMAAAGIKTYLNDVSMEIVESRLQFIDKLLEKDVSRGKIDENTKASIMDVSYTHLRAH